METLKTEEVHDGTNYDSINHPEQNFNGLECQYPDDLEEKFFVTVTAGEESTAGRSE